MHAKCIFLIFLETSKKQYTPRNVAFQKNTVECISLLVEDYESRSAIKSLNGN